MSSLVPFNRRRLMGGPIDYSGMPLTIIPLETGTLTVLIPSYVKSSDLEVLRYSLDGGANWTDIQITNEDNSVTIQNVPAGTKVQFRGYGLATANQSGNIRLLFSTPFVVQGNIMSLLFDDNFANQYSLQSKASFTFRYLFNGADMLTSAKNLILPATTLKYECYHGMFRLCERLTEPPALPAMTVPGMAYNSMFANCYALRKAPELPATTLSYGAYSWMFIQCVNLTEPPALPAMTLPDSDIYIPQSGVYESMFQGCSSLVNAPELPAKTLKSNCYNAIFDGCINLSTIKMLATDISAFNCLNNWVQNVAASGIFYKDANMVTLPTGVSGIPDGWTVIDV